MDSIVVFWIMTVHFDAFSEMDSIRCTTSFPFLSSLTIAAKSLWHVELHNGLSHLFPKYFIVSWRLLSSLQHYQFSTNFLPHFFYVLFAPQYFVTRQSCYAWYSGASLVSFVELLFCCGFSFVFCLWHMLEYLSDRLKSKEFSALFS